MVNTPLISVVIPVYNVEEYFDQCMQSVLSQTYKNLEIILVDDGSTDKSGEMCDTYAMQDKRVQVVHKENGGLVSARKAGVVLATGEYTSYIDSDDWVDIDMYENIVNVIYENNPDVVLFGSKKEYQERTELRKEYLAPGIYYKEEYEEIVKQYIKECEYFYMPIVAQYLWSKLFRTELIKEEQVKVCDEISLGEDCLSYACLLKANTVQVIDLQPYHYRVRPSSIVHTKKRYDKCLLLIQYLNNIMGDISYLRPLLIQCIYYQLALVDASKAIYFPNLRKEDRIVIYGKGVMAVAVETAIRKQQLCTIVNWVDSNNIDDLKSMDERDYDYVIIAITVHEIVRKIEELLSKMGVKNKKIMRVYPKDLKEDNLAEDIKGILKKEV